MHHVPAEVGGQIMAFVPGPERFPARIACRAMALWPTDSVADVWLAPNFADRLRHPRSLRPHAEATIDGDGWWRARAAVVRICSVVPFRCTSRKRLRDGSAVAQVLFGPAARGTVLPDGAAEEGGWAWLRRLFPAARAVEVTGPGVARVCGHWLEPPPGVVLVRDDDDDDPFEFQKPRPPSVHRTAFVDADDPNETADRLGAALGTLCRGAYPRDGNWLGLQTTGVRSFAEVADAVVAAGFVPAAAPSRADAAEPIQIAVEYLNAHASHIRLATRQSDRFVVRKGFDIDVVSVPPPVDAAPAGATMAATRLDFGRVTSESVAAVRGLRWPRLREVRVCVPALPYPVQDTERADLAERIRAAIAWALAQPRLYSLAVLAMEHFYGGAVDALFAGLGHRAARGMPPLRLELEWHGSVARVTRLVAHPAVAMVRLRVFLRLDSKAAKNEARRLCAALAAPGGPAVLRQFRLRAANTKAVLPDAALRPLVRAQPLLRELEIGW